MDHLPTRMTIRASTTPPRCMLEWPNLSLSKANLGPLRNDFDLTRAVSQCMHVHRVCDMPQGPEEVDSVTGCIRRAYEAQGAVIYLTDDT